MQAHEGQPPPTPTSSQPQPAAPVLIYRRAVKWPISWRAARRAMFLVAFLIILGVGWLHLGSFARWVEGQQRQRALARPSPVERVLWDEDPDASALLLQGKGYRTVVPKPRWPGVTFGTQYAAVYLSNPDWEKTVKEGTRADLMTEVYLGEMSNSRGERRLVGLRFYEAIDMAPGPDPGTSRKLWSVGAAVVIPGPLWEAQPQGQVDTFNAGGIVGRGRSWLRVRSGKRDPDDAAHWILGYAMPEGEGTIDVWLADDDRIRLLVRDGPAGSAPAIRHELANWRKKADTEDTRQQPNVREPSPRPWEDRQ